MDEANEIERCLAKVQEYRQDAFLLAGVAYFNYFRIPLLRQMDKSEYENEEILGVVKRLLTGNPSARDVSELAGLLVEHDEAMANGLSTVIGFELEDRQRRKEDANKI